MTIERIGEVELELDRPRPIRSASDVLRLLIGAGLVALGLVLATVAEHTVGGAQADLVEAFSRLPSAVEQVFVGLAQVIASSLVIAITIVLVVQRRWRRIGVLVAVSLTAAIAMRLADRVLELPETTQAIAKFTTGVGWLDDASFPSSAALAASAAVVTLATVWLSRRWKRVLWSAVVILAFVRVISSGTGALDVVLAIAIGVVVASLGLVIFGAPNRAPQPAALVGALQTVAPDLYSIHQITGQGDSLTYRVDIEDGDPLFVKLRTPDDRSADYLARLWRSVRLRGHEVEPPYATVQRRIEHEALLLHHTADGFASVPRVHGIIATSDGSAALVTDFVSGERMTTLDPERIDAHLLHRLWSEIGLLASARIAHRNVALENVIVDEFGRPRLVDFDDAELAAGDADAARDAAQLLVDTALLVGTDTAVAAAIAGIGSERVAASLPYLQPLALPTAVRRRLRSGDLSLPDLRTAVQAQTGTEAITLERLERVRPRTLLSIVALTAAFYVVLPQLANISGTVKAFGDAQWPWLLLVLVGSALTYFFAAIAFIGSVSEPVPFAPALRSRFASSFVSSFTPAGTGGMALGVRVLQRTGIDATSATASIGIGQVTGVVVHVALLLSFIAWTGRSGVGRFSIPDSTPLLLAFAVVLAACGVALSFQKVRTTALTPVLRVARAAGSEVAGVFRNPARVLTLFGGAAGTTLAYVFAMIAAVSAFGGHLSVAQIGTAYLGGSLVGNAAPTPGGLGAVEAALVAALTGFGLASGIAVSAVLTFRLATYWFPTVPGWFVFRWMQAHEEL